MNLSWAAFILIKKQWQEAWVWLITLSIWLAALWVDFAHH
jgi:hypothetical protein